MSNNQNQGGPKPVTIDEIISLTGVNPLKTERSQTAFNAVVKKIQEENIKKGQEALEKEVKELFTYVQDKDKLEKEFKKKCVEFDKKIRPLFNGLKGVAGNNPEPQEEPATNENVLGPASAV